MNSLVGTIFQPGVIEFHREKNQWALEMVDSRSAEESIPRLRFDPQKVLIELECSPKINPDDYPWVDRVQSYLRTADQVYLKPEDNYLRFMQAIHKVGKRQKLITLGSQTDVNAFANRFWKNIRFLFAHRKDDFRFNLGMLVTNKPGEEKKTNKIELKCRMNPDGDGGLPAISFDATGSEAPPQIVDWRKSTEMDKACRFAIEGHHIELRIVVQRQPLTFLHEFREEFNNHSFTFEGDTLTTRLKKIEKLRDELGSE